jgi:hypothetical protein
MNFSDYLQSKGYDLGPHPIVQEVKPKLRINPTVKKIHNPHHKKNYTVPLIIGGVLIAFMMMKN